MKYEILNITQQYKNGNLSAAEAMDTILIHILPTDRDDLYLRKLVAFMWDVEHSQLQGSGSPKQPESKARTMYTKLMKLKYNVTDYALSDLLDLNSRTAHKRLEAHDGYMLSDSEYRKIYNIVIKVI